MRTPTEALKEVRDRLTYFCLRTNGKYDPPWATELVEIIDESVTNSHEIGNSAAMREALIKIHDKVNSLDEECGVDPVEIRDIARSALSAPPRQCDVGTAEDQFKRYLNFCRRHEYSCGCAKCPANKTRIRGTSNCDLAWAQTPYTAKEGVWK